MNREEWASYSDPNPMLDFLQFRASERKSRLFACACLRDIWHLLTDNQSRDFVDVVERYADGAKTEVAVTTHWKGIDRSLVTNELYAALGELAFLPRDLHPYVDPPFWNMSKARVISKAVIGLAGEEEKEKRRQCDLLRCQFQFQQGFLFAFSPPVSPAVLAWHNETIPRMAQEIYESRAFDRLPLLAKALEESGCDNEELVYHCRTSDPHICGCWALDVVLRKE
jgi:hypothetical protein